MREKKPRMTRIARKEVKRMFEIKEIDNGKFDGFYEKAMRELGDFFDKDWVENRPALIFVPDRKTYNSIRGKETDDWEIAFASNDSIYVLDPKAYENDTCHVYSDENFFMLIKHELAHSFWNLFTPWHRPVWLSEGLALYLAGQHKTRIKPKGFSNFLGFHHEHGRLVYDEPGFVVGLLVDKFGKGKLLELLRDLGPVESEKEFYDLFEKVYGFKISYEKMNELLEENRPQISQIDTDGGRR